MPLDFPNDPVAGDIFADAGARWQWDGSKWTSLMTSGGPFLPLAGGALTGTLILAADPVVALHAATKQYVDGHSSIAPLAPAAVVSLAAVTVASAPAVVDGYTLVSGDRVLLAGQANKAQNGLWVFASAGTTLTRPADYAAAAVLVGTHTVTTLNGTSTKGNTYANTIFTITVDTTPVDWVLFATPLPSTFTVTGTIGAGGFGLSSGFWGNDQSAPGWSIVDDFGSIAVHLDANGWTVGLANIVNAQITNTKIGIASTLFDDGGASGLALVVQDDEGHIIGQITEDGTGTGIWGSASSQSVTATGMSTSLPLADEVGRLYNALQAGAKGNGIFDDSIALTSLHNIAMARGDRVVLLPTGSYNAPSLDAVADVVFTGDVTLLNAYRKRAIPRNASAPPAPVSGVIPSLHLPQFKSAINGSGAMVVIVGDSTSTVHNNSNSRGSYLWPALRRRIRECNPGKTVSFVNRGVPATTYVDLDGIPNSTGIAFVTGEWYSNTALPWLSYIQSLNPDLLVFNFGMNDSAAFSLPAFRSVLAKIALWTKQPDFVFCTNKQPTLQLTGYKEKANQEGRDLVAGFQRTHALMHGRGLIDLNRRFVLARDGFDLLDESIQTVATNIAVSTGTYSLPECHDFAFDWTIASASSFWAAVNTFQIQIGARAGNVFVLERDSGTGNLAVTVFADTGDTSVPRQVTSVAASTITSFYFFVRNGQASLEGPSYLQMFDGLVERMGGLFTPVVQCLNASGGVVAQSFTAANVGIGVPRLYMPMAVDSDFYGGTTFGGSTQNHSSSICISLVDEAVLDATNFCVAG